MSNKRTTRLSLLITLLTLSLVLVFTACPPVQGPDPGNGGEKPEVTEEPTTAPTEEPEPTEEVTDAPTETPTPEPTAEPTPVAEFVSAEGDIWVVPSSETVAVGDAFTTKVYVHFNESNMAAYGIFLSFDDTIIQPQRDDIIVKAEKGSDGFIAAAAYDEENVKVRVSGFDVSGISSANDMELFIVHWTAIAAGTTTIDLSIDNLTTSNTIPIDSSAHNTSLTVTD